MQRDIRKYFINCLPPIEKKLHELFLIVVSPVSPVALWLVFNGRLRLICKNSRWRQGVLRNRFCFPAVCPGKRRGKRYLPFFSAAVFLLMSMTTNSDLVPVLNFIAQSERPEVTMKFVLFRFSRP